MQMGISPLEALFLLFRCCFYPEKKKKAQLELKKTTAERQLKTSMHLKQCLRH